MLIRVGIMLLMTCSLWARNQNSEYKLKFSNGNELIYNYSPEGKHIVAFKDNKFDRLHEIAHGHIYLTSSVNTSSFQRVEKHSINLTPNEKSFAVSLVDSFLFVTFENGNTVVVDKAIESDLSELQIRHEKINGINWIVLSYFRDTAKEKGYAFMLNSDGKIQHLESRYHNLTFGNYFFNAKEGVFNLFDKEIKFRTFDDKAAELETPLKISEKSITVKNVLEVNKGLNEAGVTYQDMNPREVGAGEAKEKAEPWYENYQEQLRGVDIIHDVDASLKRRIYEALVDPVSGNAVLVSKPGAGKTTLANLIAWEIINHKAPSYFDKYEVLYFDASTISAGSKYRGEFEDKVQELKTMSQQRNILWVIDNFTSLKGEGTHSNSNKDILDMLAPELSKGHIRILAMADVDLYDQTITNEQIRSKVTKINVEQKWGEKELVKVLQNYAQTKYEYKISPKHIRSAMEFAEKGEATAQEPARSLRLIRKILNRKLLAAKDESFRVTQKMIQDSAIELYGFDPAEYKLEAAQSKLVGLEEALRRNIIGQEMMVEATLKAARLVYTDTHDNSKARMGLFFTGPAGLGKTEIPKVYAKAMDKPFYRISMGQYTTPEPGTLEKLKHSIYREIQKNPHTVLFFDELDKSPMFIQDGLLELFDNKTFNVREKLDASGSMSKITHVDISQADVFFAGNSAVEYINSLSFAQKEEATNRIGFHAQQNIPANQVLVNLYPHEYLDKNTLEQVILYEQKISPYLLSRMVDIVPAFPSNPNTFEAILGLHIDRAVKDLAQRHKVSIEFQPNDKEFLVENLRGAYWVVNRDNRVDGIINDWIREPISRSLTEYGAEATNGFKIYVPALRDSSDIHVLPKETEVPTGYQCARLFL